MADKLNFLLPVDLLQESESAVEYASTRARTVGASLHLVHIIEEESPLQKLVLNNGQRDMIRRGAADKLDELAGKHLVHPEINFTTTILQGKVYNKIIYAAREVKADIIFMGRTDSSDMKKNLTGTQQPGNDESCAYANRCGHQKGGGEVVLAIEDDENQGYQEDETFEEHHVPQNTEDGLCRRRFPDYAFRSGFGFLHLVIQIIGARVSKA